MRKIYLFLGLVTFLLSNAVKAQLPTKCFEIQSILVDACGTPEGTNEMVRFVVGSTPINAYSLDVTWATVGAPGLIWRGICANPDTTAALNATITKCGLLLEPPGGIIPAGATVVFATNVAINTVANSFADLTDTVYIIYQCSGNPVATGHFANSGTGVRSFSMRYPPLGCGDTVAYDRSLLQGGDGAFVSYNFAGNATYSNSGCKAIIPVSSVFAGNDTIVCPSTTQIGLKGSKSGVKSSKWISLGTGLFSQPDSLTSTYTLSGTDVFPITFYLKGYLGCGDSIQDTIIYNKYTNTVNAGVDDSICAGTSLNGLASGGSNYNWSPSANVSDPSIANPVLSPTVTTDYTVTANYGIGCVGADTVRITVFNIDTIILTKDTTICFGQSVQLNASNVPSVVFSPATSLSCTACLTPVASNPANSITYTAISNGYCPDTNTISITVNKAITTSQIFDVCDSILFLGKTYYASATVIDTTKSSLGCDSIIRTSQINVITTSTNYVYHCINTGDSILIAGVYQKTQGIYMEFIPNGICSDKLIHVLQVVTKQTVNIPIVACNSTVYKGTTYTASAVVSDTLKSALGCDSVYTIANITINNNSSIYNTSVCINNGQSYFVGGANQTTTGIYRDTFALASGCDSIIVTDLKVITPFNNNNAVQACKQYTYKGITYTTSTVVKDTVKSVLGCDSVYNNFAIAINNQIVTANISACILTGQGYVTGGVNHTTTGVYRDTVALASGCDSVTVLNLNVINPSTNSNSVQSCDPYTYNGTTYNSSTIVSDTVFSVQGCDSIYNVMNIAISAFKYYDTVKVCINQGQTYFAGGANQSTSGLYTDKLTTVFGCDSFITTNLNVITVTLDTIRIDSCNQVTYSGTVYTQNTTLNNTISSVQGCDSVERTVIIGIKTLSVNITESNGTLPVNFGESVQLNANTSGPVNSYVWTPTQYVVGSNTGNNIVVKPESNTTYQIVVKDAYCTAISSIVVNVIEPDTKFAMPTAFTPNGDGVNDLYRPILMPNLVTKEFRIYNRWGEKVFESTAIEPGWDGTFRDSKQPVGVYVYYISVQNTITNKTVYHSGNITLIR
jgi:gliding motility-associated-like protein